MRPDQLLSIPSDLPVPTDDGGADHLRGAALPPIALPATDGTSLRLDDPAAPATVVFAFPRMGRPGEEPIGGLEAWDAIPGARGCTPEACGYRDRWLEFEALGLSVVGLSTQDTAYQQEAVERLALPYPLLSDERLALAEALDLPRWDHHGHVLLKRLTFVVEAGRIAWVEYPVFPPDGDAARVLEAFRTGTIRRPSQEASTMSSDPAIDPAVPPSGPGCVECTAEGGWWFHLRRCAACGHVGCCDSSPSQHASRHAREAGHPVARTYEPGEDWFWDYEAEEVVEAPELMPPLHHPLDQPSPGPAGRVPADWQTRLH